MREQIVKLTATHDELHEISIPEIDLESEESDQLRNVVFDVFTHYGSFDWVQPFAFQTLVDLVSSLLALLIH